MGANRLRVNCSTCFGRHTAHHQELKTVIAASGFTYIFGCRPLRWLSHRSGNLQHTDSNLQHTDSNLQHTDSNLQHTDRNSIASSPTQQNISYCHIIMWPVREDNTQKLIRHSLTSPLLSYLLPSAIW